MKQILLLTTGLIFSVYVFSGDISYHIKGGANYSLVRLKSDADNIDKNPNKSAIGYNFGVGTRLKLNNRLTFTENLNYSFLRYKGEDIIVTDLNGTYLGVLESEVHNNSLQLEIIGEFYVFKNIYLGTGFTNHYLLKSSTVFDKQVVGMDSKKYENTYYSKWNFTIPVILGYRFLNFDIYARFNKGFKDQIKGDLNSVKEILNYISAGTMFTF